ncbi:hypothetical protein PN498_26380 [Oscillatoria sp. CS-180]|uniref:hypothetical protein n=1 Tax=Oscillatoria sp. CS-180 TaxID=3021720 RepID=UPI002330EFBD|nr:hypothetical protein [Oscillatoria sp. CS-180]MDB9529545.1 hypothetical protein [Oscillatoria sp. CS-180]
MYFDYALEQERTEANDAARCEAEEAGIQAARNLGAADATFVRELPTYANGALIHHSPHRHFCWSDVDTPEQSRASNEF